MISASAFILLLIAGMPIAFALVALALIYVAQQGNWVLLSSVPQQIFGGLENYGLLALPLFILLSEFMNAGGIGQRLIALALALLGPVKGGLAYVNLVANMMMASILGSTVAQITVMSKLAVPEMERAGYPRDISVAITAAGGLLAPIVPPSMMFIIFGVIAQIPIGDLFIAGIVPGIMMFIAFIFVISYLGMRYGFPKTEPVSVRERVQSGMNALPALLIPIVIIGSILGGIATPTEAAAVATVSAILIGHFVYKELDWNDVFPAFCNAARSTAIVLLLIAAAQLFSWVITFENIPAEIADWMQHLTSSPIAFLLMLNVILLLLGTFMDPIPAIILIVPVFLPVAVSVYGIDPFHFGVVVCLNLTLGLLTPPVGSGLFTAALMSGEKAEKIAWLIMPFFVAVVAIIIALALMPSLTTTLIGWL